MSSANLIQRLTDATGNERGLFEEAWDLIHHYGYGPENERDTCRLCDRFTAMLDAEAWTSAAEMLLDLSRFRIVTITQLPNTGQWGVKLRDIARDEALPAVAAFTEANARTIAALKAHGGNDAE